MATLKNSQNAYGLITIIIHWLFAIAVCGLFGLGLYMVELTYYDTWYKGSLDLHKSIGIVLFIFLLARLVWRFINVQPTPEAGEKWEHLSAALVHGLLYLLPLSLMVSGYLISTADGRAIEVFELFSIGALPPLMENQEDSAGLIHLVLAWSTIGIATLHGLAALKHHFINKDQTLNRMIGRNKNHNK